jgi:hypothetical protein
MQARWLLVPIFAQHLSASAFKAQKEANKNNQITELAGTDSTLEVVEHGLRV